MKIQKVICMSALLLLLCLVSCNKEKTTTYETGSNDRNGITDTEILIGTCAPLSGHASFLGTELTKGADCMLRSVNESGGIHGRKIRTLVYDDQYEPQKTAQLTGRLVNDDRVFMLINYVGTPTAKAIVPVVNSARIPVFGLFTGAEFLRTPLQPYIYNVRASYFKEVELMVDRWVAAKKKRIAVFMQDDAFGEAVSSGAELALARHNRSVAGIGRFKRGTIPDDATVKKMAGLDPDAIVMVGTSDALAAFVRKAKDAGLHGTEFYTVSFVGSEAFAAALKARGEDTAANVYVTQVVPSPFDESNAVVRRFLKDLARYYPGSTPNYVALEGYINAVILTETLQKSGRDLSRGRLMWVLEEMGQYNADTGLRSVIDRQNHSFFESVFLSGLKNGRFEIIRH